MDALDEAVFEGGAHLAQKIFWWSQQGHTKNRCHKLHLENRLTTQVFQNTVICTLFEALMIILLSLVDNFCVFALSLVFAEQATRILCCCWNTNYWQEMKQESKVSRCCNLRDHQCFWSKVKWIDEKPNRVDESLWHASIWNLFASPLKVVEI